MLHIDPRAPKTLIVSPEMWVTSDQHWGHGNMIRLQNRPPNHDSLMIQEWERRVAPGETVLHLGDLMWATAGHWMPAVKALPGEKFLIRGNHDQLSTARYESIGFTVLSSREEWATFFYAARFNNQTVVFSHGPVLPAFLDSFGGGAINVHGHVHSRTRQDARYRNACVEARGYGPTRLSDLLQEQL